MENKLVFVLTKEEFLHLSMETQRELTELHIEQSIKRLQEMDEELNGQYSALKSLITEDICHVKQLKNITYEG